MLPEHIKFHRPTMHPMLPCLWKNRPCLLLDLAFVYPACFFSQSGQLRTGLHFRLCVLAYRCLHGSAPQYLAETLHLTSDTEVCCRLRSGSRRLCSCRRLGDPVSGISCGRSAIMEHSPGLPANSFILPYFSPRTQDLPV